MKDQVVLITGADGGLGTHLTNAFLDARDLPVACRAVTAFMSNCTVGLATAMPFALVNSKMAGLALNGR